MRVAHLSDIHLSNNNIDDFRSYYVDALIDDLKAFNNGTKIDVIIISGDLVDKGGISFSNLKRGYKEFEENFIEPIKKALNIGNNRIIMVPGNHDIEESKIDSILESGLVKELNSIDSTNKFLKKIKNPAEKGRSIKRQEIFTNFEQDFYGKDFKGRVTALDSSHILEIDSHKVGIACINSSWRCSTKLDQNKLVVGTKQLMDADEVLEEHDCNFKIAILHHPLDYISEMELSEFQSLLYKLDYKLVFTGHTHNGGISLDTVTTGSFIEHNSRSSFNNPRESVSEFQPGYTIVDINENTDSIDSTFHFRKFINERKEFDNDVHLAKDGKTNKTLKLGNQTNELQKTIDLSRKTLSSKVDDINSHLVVAGTDTDAPKELNDLYVEPNLSDVPEFMGEVDDINNAEQNSHYKTVELLKQNGNVLLVGPKEVGKTTILNKLFLETLTSTSFTEKIPVKISFNDLKNKEVINLTKKFLNEGTQVVKKLFSEGKVILLIDDLEINNTSQRAKNNLRKALEQYPGTRIIATTSESYDQLLIRFDKFFSTYQFKPIYVNYVGITQFKNLSINWFQRDNFGWLKENYEKLIKVFKILRIPRTFFSLSLFLWIIEKQENFKPVNRYNLVEHFLQLILEGLKTNNVQAGEYNYQVKIDLLRELSLEMYKKGDEDNDYCLSESQTLKCFERYFELNMREFSASEKLDEFIDKRILRYCNNGASEIVFRFEAFFQYFLSLNIGKNDDFTELVYSDDNFLSFIEELDFYTGRVRDDKETLEKVLDWLSQSFRDVDKIIDEEIDKYFPSESLLLKHVDARSFLSESRKQKLTNEEIEEVLDEEFKVLPVDDEIQTKSQHDYEKEFHKVLELSARVLKNSENIKDPELIKRAVDLIFSKASKFGALIHNKFLKQWYEEEEMVLPVPVDFILVVAPLITQIQLLTWIGTGFLEKPLKDKIKKILDPANDNVSEFELFLVTFVYTDLRLNDHPVILSDVVAYISNKFVTDIFFLKIFLYYMMRPENSSLISRYENQMLKLLGKTKNISGETEKRVKENLREHKGNSDEDNQLGFFED